MSKKRIEEILYNKCYSCDEGILDYIQGRVKTEKELREKAEELIDKYLTLQ